MSKNYKFGLKILKSQTGNPVLSAYTRRLGKKALRLSTVLLGRCGWIKWMANSIVFIMMVTHQCAFAPRLHFQDKALQKMYNVANTSVRREEDTVPWPPPQTLKKCKNSIV